MCEVLSLTGNPCTNPLHKGGSGDGINHDADNRYQKKGLNDFNLINQYFMQQ